jgi:hypothetical protein
MPRGQSGGRIAAAGAERGRAAAWGRLGAPNKPKQVQAKPNKSKQKSLDLLGIICPNWAFSMGYGRKNKKIFRLRLCANRLTPPPISPCSSADAPQSPA